MSNQRIFKCETYPFRPEGFDDSQSHHAERSKFVGRSQLDLIDTVMNCINKIGRNHEIGFIQTH